MTALRRGQDRLILNLIASLIAQGKTVIAGANTAVDNVIDKLTRGRLQFLVASLRKSGARQGIPPAVRGILEQRREAWAKRRRRVHPAIANRAALRAEEG